jgi:hypothetical protein
MDTPQFRCGGAGRRDRPADQRLPRATGHSKWNKIEHRLFSQITMSWRGRPLSSHETIINLIGATTTTTGLPVTAPARYRRLPNRHQN